MKSIVLYLIKLYQAIPRLPSCRYTPSCSSYMSEAVTKYGVVKGGYKGAKRICRCHPWGGHGYDPVD